MYPPANRISSIRTSKHTKYLYENNWKPFVIAGTPYYYIPCNLEAEIPSDLITYIKWFDPHKFLKKIYMKFFIKKNKVRDVSEEIKDSKYKSLKKKQNYLVPIYNARMPDRHWNWIKPAVKKGLEIIKEENIDLIFSSFGPPASHIAASKLQELTGIPWVAEYRDLWSQNPYEKRSDISRKIEKVYEKAIMKNASAFITVSSPLKENLINLHRKPTYIIYNGFDKTDFMADTELTSKFTITYTGTIYPGKRDPSPLFKAISLLEEKNKQLLKNLEIRFFGRELDKIIYDLAAKYGVEDYVVYKGEVDHDTAVKSQKESILLLLLSWNNPADAGVLTGKIFEYLGAERPILAFGYPKGAINNLLDVTNAGIMLNDPKNISLFLEESLQIYKKNPDLGFQRKQKEIEKYTREAQTNKMIEIFEEYI
jgi:hypothetical protein